MALLSDPNWRLTHTLYFVRRLGFELGLDLDGELEIAAPAAVDPEAMTGLLRECAKSLAHELKDDARRSRKQFVGGPCNGQRYGFTCSPWVAKRLRRGKWAAYFIPDEYDDCRAFYVGEATSEGKARKLALTQGPKLFPKTKG